jgi:hypothetical protein
VIERTFTWLVGAAHRQGLGALTRALSDFAKIVEILDATGTSFVSVTQAFNTTTGMGRLTFNVLLSFAQFEREVATTNGFGMRDGQLHSAPPPSAGAKSQQTGYRNCFGLRSFP